MQHSEEFDGFWSAAADLDPDEWLWLPGVDYAGGWRAAQHAAEVVNTALHSAELAPGEVRASADTRADGSPVVRLRCSVAGAVRLARLLEVTNQAGKDGRNAA